MSTLSITLITIAVIIALSLMFLASRYRRCAPNQIMVIEGSAGATGAAKCIHGGGAFIIPLKEDYSYLSLVPIAVEIPLKDALTNQNIRVDVPSTFTVAIGTGADLMANAANRLLGLSESDIREQAGDIITGQLRQTIAEMSIEEINTDRDRFLELIQTNVGNEINKIGLYLINVNIQDITDEAGYIKSIGQKAASTAINQANIDVAEQQKLGAIGVQNATQEQEVAVADSMAKSAKGQAEANTNERVFVSLKNAEAVSGENSAQQDIAKSDALLEIIKTEASRDTDVAYQNAQMKIQVASKSAEEKRLEVETVVPATAAAAVLVIESEAKAKTTVIQAQGEADAAFAVAQKEADGVQAMLDAQAIGFKNIIAAAGSAENAAQLLLIDQAVPLAEITAKAIAGLEIDNLTVWETGGGSDGQSGGLKSLMDGFLAVVPGAHDLLAKSGIKLPAMLGELIEQGAETPSREAGEAAKSDKPLNEQINDLVHENRPDIGGA